MGAAVRLEESVWSDPRFRALGILLGVPHEFAAEVAVARVAKLWRHCTDRGEYVVPDLIVNAIIDPDRGADALVEAGLGRRVDGGIHVAGTEGRIEWLAKKRAAAKKGGESRWNGKREQSQGGAGGMPNGMPPGMPNGIDSGCPPVPAPVRELPPKSPQGDSASEPSQPKRPPKPLHPQASALAEHLRGAVLAEKPDHALGKPSGWTDKRRRSWERSCHAILHTDGRSFARACELVDWVFGDQGGADARFVVESPKSLREKWDRIEAAMQRRGGGGTPQSTLELLGPGWRDA